MAQEISYSQNLLAGDAQFIGRIASILKDEGHSPKGEDPTEMAYRYRFDVAAEPGLAESYHSALLSGVPDPGASGEVITDPVLTSAVAAVMGGTP